jgi:hypothetical protein
VGFRVLKVTLTADPTAYAGSCPTTITFSGQITVAGGSGKVSYTFLRSDGASAPVTTVTFDEPGSVDVGTTWTLGGSDFSYSGWQAVRILSPQRVDSDKAEFTVKCAAK